MLLVRTIKAEQSQHDIWYLTKTCWICTNDLSRFNAVAQLTIPPQLRSNSSYLNIIIKMSRQTITRLTTCNVLWISGSTNDVGATSRCSWLIVRFPSSPNVSASCRSAVTSSSVSWLATLSDKPPQLSQLTGWHVSQAVRYCFTDSNQVLPSLFSSSITASIINMNIKLIK